MRPRIASRIASCSLSLLASACVVLPAAPPEIEQAQDGQAMWAMPVRSAAYPPNYIECMRDPLRPGCPGTAEQRPVETATYTQPAPAPTPADPALAGRAALGLAAIVLSTFAISFGISRGMASMYRIPPISKWPQR